MFGLTLEKLVVVAVLAAFIIGPQRFAQCARLLSDTVRSLRGFVDATRARAADDLGIPLTRAEWEALDLRRYDPRHIMREAVDHAAPVPPRGGVYPRKTEATMPNVAPPGAQPEAADPDHTAASLTDTEVAELVALEGLDKIRPGQKYLIVGDSAHPRRIRIDSLPPDDPRRLAANRVQEENAVSAARVGDESEQGTASTPVLSGVTSQSIRLG